MANITAPVYGFYAGNDARIDATIPATVDAMKAAGKIYAPVTYDGAGHGFMRAGVDPANTVDANKTARQEGFARITSELAKLHSTPTKKAQVLSSPVQRDSASAKHSAPQCHDGIAGM